MPQLRLTLILPFLLLLIGCSTATQPQLSTNLPDAALVAPCDVANAQVTTTEEIVAALLHTRTQRDECAAQVAALAAWRASQAK